MKALEVARNTYATMSFSNTSFFLPVKCARIRNRRENNEV